MKSKGKTLMSVQMIYNLKAAVAQKDAGLGSTTQNQKEPTG